MELYSLNVCFAAGQRTFPLKRQDEKGYTSVCVLVYVRVGGTYCKNLWVENSE